MRFALVAAAAGALALGCAPAGVDAPRAPRAPQAPVVAALPPAAAPPVAQLVERALPAVVLITATHADGSVSYGAGTLVDAGVALTSRHVIANAKTLGVMLYKPGRATYTPMDGGLSRFLFENQRDVVSAKEIAGDDTTDLALVRIDADTSRLPVITLATSALAPGDRVFALGHPQEMVWSFTQGAASAIQQNAIQHDAAISHGSSGGPLLNARGEMVGVNVAKVVSEPTGLAFARPIALASRYLGDRRVALGPLDLSTPETAAVSCWRGQEIGRIEVGDCFDWDDAWQHARRLAAEAMSLAPDDATRARLAKGGDAADKQRYIDLGRRHVSGYFVEGSSGEACDPKQHAEAVAALPKPLRDAQREIDKKEAALVRAHPELAGVRAERDSPALLKARLRLGIRVDRVAHVGPKLAWVELVGRNPDSTLYRFSELYANVGGRWLQRITSVPDEEAKLPRDFAPPFDTYEAWRVRKLSWLLEAPRDDDGASMSSRPGAASCGGSSDHGVMSPSRP